MATFEQFEGLLRANAEFMTRLQATQVEAMTTMMQGMMAQRAERAPKGGLDERKFREVGIFGGNEETWKEFALKFKATTKEANNELFEAMKWAEGEDQDIDDEALGLKFGEEEGEQMGVVLYNRLIHHLSGPALTIHQTVLEENGLEVWRRLSKRFNPMTPMRGLQIMLKVMLPPKITKQQDVHTQVNKWEGQINMLERDYKETVSDMMKIGLLIHMMPDELQDSILQHADRLREYRLVKEKAVNLVDARARLRDPNAMDVGYAGYCRECEEETHYEDVGAVGEASADRQCFRCGGYGHVVAGCATPKGQ